VNRRDLLVATPLLLGGCAFFTKPTGLITIERQQFINTWAVVKVLYARLRERFDGPAEELALVDRQARALAVQIDAKIAVPESEIDWAVVKEFLSVLVGLVP